MRRLVLAGVVFAVGVLSAAPVAAAHDRSPFAPREAGAPLLAASWQDTLSTPTPENPAAGNGDPCVRINRYALAPWFPLNGASCTVKWPTWILATTFSAECSDGEDPPYHGDTPAERRACSLAAIKDVTLNEVTIDGRTYDVSRYRVTTLDHWTRLPEDDIYGLDRRSLRWTASGYAPVIEPLSPGRHTITSRSAGEFPGSEGPFDGQGTLQLTVKR